MFWMSSTCPDGMRICVAVTLSPRSARATRCGASCQVIWAGTQSVFVPSSRTPRTSGVTLELPTSPHRSNRKPPRVAGPPAAITFDTA